MSHRILLDDSYRGTGITVLMDKGKLIACAKGNDTDFRAVFTKGHVDTQGVAPQPIVSRINEIVTRFHRMPIIPGDIYEGNH